MHFTGHATVPGNDKIVRPLRESRCEMQTAERLKKKGPAHLIAGFLNIWRLLGRRGIVWVAIGMLSSLVLAGTEYVIAILLIVFLFTLNLVDPSQMPAWLPVSIWSLSPTMILIVLLFVGILRAVSQLVSRQTGHVVLEFVQARLKMVQGYRMLMGEKQHTISLSQLNLHMGECFPKASNYVYHSVELISKLTQMGALAVAMFYLAWQETLVGILCLSVAGLAIFKLNKLLARISAKIPELRAQFERTLVRICRNWLLIRILHVGAREYRVYLDSVLAYFKSGKKAFFYRNISSVLPPLLGIVAIGVILLTSVRYFGTLPLALVGLVYLFIRFTQATVVVTGHIGVLNHFHAQFSQSVELFSSLSPNERAVALRAEQAVTVFGTERKSELLPPDGKSHDLRYHRVKSTSPPKVSVCKVTFLWPHTDHPVIEDLSVTIPAGSQFGIVGPNGSGKTTLLNIILGVLKPSAGHVLIGGVKCEEFVKESRSIGYVGEYPHLFHGSIRDNLIYGMSGEVSEKDIRNALEMVRLDAVIRNVTGGLEYIIGEEGEGFSSGQKQRLSLARAFLRKPLLLVLDEASANLDRAAEGEIADILKKLIGRCTVIIASHRLGILRNVDHILDLGVRFNEK